MLKDINNMNQGLDFKGQKLSIPTNLCAGASIDLNKDQSAEISLTQKKLFSGSKFFVTQPIFDPQKALDFQDSYAKKYSLQQIPNVFWGIQILGQDNFSFSHIPDNLKNDLNKGRSGIDIAIEQINLLLLQKMRLIYLIPTIFPNGTRDYESAQKVIEFFKLQSY